MRLMLRLYINSRRRQQPQAQLCSAAVQLGVGLQVSGNVQLTADTWLRSYLSATSLLLGLGGSSSSRSSPSGCQWWQQQQAMSQHTWAGKDQDKLAAAAAIATEVLAAEGRGRYAAAAGEPLYYPASSSSDEDTNAEPPWLHPSMHPHISQPGVDLGWPDNNARSSNSSSSGGIPTTTSATNKDNLYLRSSSSSSSSSRTGGRLLFGMQRNHSAYCVDSSSTCSRHNGDWEDTQSSSSSSSTATGGRKKRSGKQQHQTRQQQETAHVIDMRLPAAWYPLARAMTRQLVAHVGPTNSGKTHAALTSLMAAHSGVYCGPLRLLTCEVADRLNAAGVPCNLVTGQEVRRVPGARHTACTVEMVDLDHNVEVAVLDEVQMLADKARGWSWTRAVLGLPARSLHACGDPAATGLILQLAEDCGDQLSINRYKRLSPLVCEPHALPGLSAVQEGDCVVAFGRKALHRLRKNILKAGTQRQHGVGMVYGALPPESRRTQAALFNAGPQVWPRYSVLVASDAVGMGLNLNIRRVVFASMHKYDGEEFRPLTPSEVKQIAGRAGRFGSSHAAGYVSCLNQADVPLLRQCLATASEEIEEACLLPRFEQLEQYARSRRHRLPFYQLLSKFAAAAKLSGPYFLADMANMVALARVLRHLEPEGLDLKDMFTWCTAPAGADDPAVLQALLSFATLYVNERRVTPDCMRGPTAHPPASPVEMKAAEELFRVYDLYLWLEGRVGHGVFKGRKQVQQQRAAVAALIDQGLRTMGGVSGNPAEDDGLRGAAAVAKAKLEHMAAAGSAWPGHKEASSDDEEQEAELADGTG